jgi:hypothetical protein
VMPVRVFASEAQTRSFTTLQLGPAAAALADGRLALGVAYGNRPMVLVFDAQGSGDAVRPDVAAGSPLANDVATKDGTRDVQRVTPASAPGGGVRAYVDYRDKSKNGERRVSCGAVDTGAALVSYSGKPLLDVDDSGKGRTLPTTTTTTQVTATTADSASPATPAASNSAAPAGSGTFKLTLGSRPLTLPAGSAAASATPPPAAAPPTKPKEKDEAKRELRDCRSVVDPGGESAWAIGSELVGEEKDGKTQWSMRLFVSAGSQKHRLYTVKLGDAPKKLFTFENPVARRLENGSSLLAARYQGALYAFLVDSNKRPNGPTRVYRGGYPTLPRVSPDGADTLVLLSQKTGDDSYGLWFGRLSTTKPSLPSALSALTLDAIDTSLAEPNLALVGAQRWLSVQAGKRRSERFVVIPVDAGLAPMGAPLTLGAGKGAVSESRLFALGGGRLLAVYLRGSELVSTQLECSG